LLIPRRTRPARLYLAASALIFIGTGYVLAGGWRVIAGTCCLIAAAATAAGLLEKIRQRRAPAGKS
jgi:hypothetical protein